MNNEQRDETRVPFKLEERTLLFAKNIRVFVKKIPKNVANFEDSRQLVRSSGSIGANYIEANECLGKKDFTMRIRISRKEAKESRFWLDLIDVGNDKELEAERYRLVNETTEFIKIFSSIVNKSV